MRKRVFAMTLMLILLLCLLPVPSYAVDSAHLADGDFIYMGSFDGEPVKWRVLDADAMNTGEPGAFLFSEYILQKAGTAYAEAEAGWQGSLAQAWCGQFYADAFTDGERSVIPAVSKTEDATQLFGLRWREAELIDENVFFISSPELATYIGSVDGAEGLGGCLRDGKPWYYWLRSSHLSHPDYAGLVIDDNQVHDFLVYLGWGTKPAMNLDLSKVIELSPAYEGAQGEWKLTVTDESRTLSVDGVRLNGVTLEADYSGAACGEGEYITLLVKNAAGRTLHSERLCKSEASSGTVKIGLAALKLRESEKLYLVSEKDGGERMTDYVGEPCELACRATFNAGEGGGTMDSEGFTPGIPFTLPDCGFAAPEHREFDHWELDGEKAENPVTIAQDAQFTAIYRDIPVSSISFSNPVLELVLGKKASIIAKVEPDDAMDKSLIWSLSGDAVTITDKGESCIVKAAYPGTALVTAASKDGNASASFTVNVSGSVITAVALDYGVYVLAGAAVLLAVTVLIRKRKKK